MQTQLGIIADLAGPLHATLIVRARRRLAVPARRPSRPGCSVRTVADRAGLGRAHRHREPGTAGPRRPRGTWRRPGSASGYVLYGAEWVLAPGTYQITVTMASSGPCIVEVWDSTTGVLLRRRHLPAVDGADRRPVGGPGDRPASVAAVHRVGAVQLPTEARASSADRSRSGCGRRRIGAPQPLRRGDAAPPPDRPLSGPSAPAAGRRQWAVTVQPVTTSCPPTTPACMVDAGSGPVGRCPPASAGWSAMAPISVSPVHVEDRVERRGVEGDGAPDQRGGGAEGDAGGHGRPPRRLVLGGGPQGGEVEVSTAVSSSSGATLWRQAADGVPVEYRATPVGPGCAPGRGPRRRGRVAPGPGAPGPARTRCRGRPRPRTRVRDA